MKNHSLFVLFIFILPALSNAQSLQVSYTEAEAMAKHALKKTNRMYSEKEPVIVDVFEKVYGENTALYEFLFEMGESVIIAGSKASRPILAVNENSTGYSWIQNKDSIVDGFTLMLDGMYQRIGESFLSAQRPNGNWEINDSEGDERVQSVIGPLLDTKWGQSRARNCNSCDDMYNKYMPYSNGDCECGNIIQRYVSGCTVTALAQLMNYWKYPVLYNGVEQIDWCNMPPEIDCSVTTDVQNEAVARLYKIIGETFETRYGHIFSIGGIEIGSGCYGYLDPASTDGKMQTVFKYADTINVIERAFTPQWETRIRDEINEHRPVLYWAFEENPLRGAHTFVCDGYNLETELFHFNWGHRNESWCSINYITENTNTHWTLYECAMIGIKPRFQESLCNYVLNLDLFYHDFYAANSNSTYLPYQITPQTMSRLISASATSPESWHIIPAGVRTTYRAHNEIDLRDGFTVEAGADFTAEIVPCPSCDSRGVDDTGMNVIPSGVDTATDSATPPATDYMAPRHPALPAADLYPNPTSGELTMAVEGEVQAVLVYNAMGAPADGWQLRSVLDDGRVVLDVKPLSAGIYLLTIRTADGKLHTSRFVRR